MHMNSIMKVHACWEILVTILLLCLSPHCGAHLHYPTENPNWQPKTISNPPQHKPSLEYYVQVAVGPPYKLEPQSSLNRTSIVYFGAIQAYEFNITAGVSLTSKPLGHVHGYTVECSYTSISHQVEVEVISYNDGDGIAGTISLQGLIDPVASNVITIVGGTGAFIGVRGNVVITMLEPRCLYHHALYFLP